MKFKWQGVPRSSKQKRKIHVHLHINFKNPSTLGKLAYDARQLVNSTRTTLALRSLSTICAREKESETGREEPVYRKIRPSVDKSKACQYELLLRA